MKTEERNIEQKIDEELRAAMSDGPTFSDKSRLQIEKFVVGKHITPSRAYRQILLEMNIKVTALKKSRIRRKKITAEIELLKEKITFEVNPNQREIYQCDIDDKIVDMESEDKLIMDAISECNFLYAMFEKSKKFTAEEFEEQEAEYWKKRLTVEAQYQMLAHGTVNPGTLEALRDLGFAPAQALVDLKKQANSLFSEASTPAAPMPPQPALKSVESKK